MVRGQVKKSCRVTSGGKDRSREGCTLSKGFYGHKERAHPPLRHGATHGYVTAAIFLMIQIYKILLGKTSAAFVHVRRSGTMEGRRGTRSATPQGNNKADMLDESSQHSQTYLLDRMGGEAALEAVVEEFYVRLIGDPKLKHFFEGVNMRKLKRHQRGFLKVAFTKIPDSIDVPMLLLKKHERLFSEMSLDETHFDLVAAHLIETMQSLGLKQTLIDEAVAIVAPLRSVFEAGATSGKKNGVHVKILNSGSYMSSESDDGAVRALLRSLKFSGVKFLRFMVVDACNNIRSKAVPLEQCRVDTVVTFAKVCFAGLPFFADIVLPQTGFDARDLLVVRPDFGTLRILPYNTSSAAVLCTAHDGDTLSPLCTRGLLARVVETAQSEHNLVFVSAFLPGQLAIVVLLTLGAATECWI